MNKDWKFTFGKYKGKTLEDVYYSDVNYIDFCLTTIKWLSSALIESKDDWIHKMVINVSKLRKQYNNDLEAWAWGVTSYPTFGHPVKIIYDGRDDDSELFTSNENLLKI